MTYKTVVEDFCAKMGIGSDRRIKSTRGRTGRVTGLDYCPYGNGKVWIQIDDTPGNVRIPQHLFNVPTKTPNTPNAS